MIRGMRYYQVVARCFSTTSITLSHENPLVSSTALSDSSIRELNIEGTTEDGCSAKNTSHATWHTTEETDTRREQGRSDSIRKRWSRQVYRVWYANYCNSFMAMILTL